MKLIKLNNMKIIVSKENWKIEIQNELVDFLISLDKPLGLGFDLN